MVSIGLLRGALFAMSALLGGFGVFFLYYSFIHPPVASYALVFLGTALAIGWFANSSTQNH